MLLTGADRLVVLDVDEVCSSDPERDLGTALAQLRWQAVRLPEQRWALLAVEDALLAGYEERAGTVDPDTLRWWRAAGLVQVAARRYRRLEVAAWPRMHLLADAVERLLTAPGKVSVTPGRPDILDPAELSRVLRAAIRPLAVAPRTVRIDSAVELTSASGRRSVFRCAVRGLDGPGATPVIGKLFAEPRRARLLHDHLRLLASGPFPAGGDLRVPGPLALVPEQRMVVYRAADGVRLDLVVASDAAADGMRGAARWLARLHGCDLRLPRRFDLTQESGSTRQWATQLARLHPRLGVRAHRLAGQWASAVPPRSDQLPIHKDFHAGHVLVGDGICVIDLDEARMGDPAFDIAHFCTYLELSGDGGAGASRLRRTFLSEYADASGWVDDGGFAPYCAYTWLKIAKQWAMGSGPGKDAAPARRLLGADRALARGQAWLDG